MVSLAVLQAVNMPMCLAAVLLACMMASATSTEAAATGVVGPPGVQLDDRFSSTHNRGMKVRGSPTARLAMLQVFDPTSRLLDSSGNMLTNALACINIMQARAPLQYIQTVCIVGCKCTALCRCNKLAKRVCCTCIHHVHVSHTPCDRRQRRFLTALQPPQTVF